MPVAGLSLAGIGLAKSCCPPSSSLPAWTRSALEPYRVSEDSPAIIMVRPLGGLFEFAAAGGGGQSMPLCASWVSERSQLGLMVLQAEDADSMNEFMEHKGRLRDQLPRLHLGDTGSENDSEHSWELLSHADGDSPR